MISFDIKDKVVVITGAGGVLCSTMAYEMAQLGAKIALLDIAEERIAAIAGEICQSGGEAISVACNVLETESITAAKDAVVARYGRVDVLINGAGGNKPAATASPELSFFDMPADSLSWVLNLNLLGTIYPTQVFGRQMAEQGFGCVINISSMSAYTPLTNTVAYSAAKAAVSNFTSWMATHFAQNYSPKIRVNAIAPGFLHTQQNHYLLVNSDGTPSARGQKIIAGTPMGRYGRPEEMVGAIVYLCSEAASFVTGIVLPIDGGYNSYSGV